MASALLESLLDRDALPARRAQPRGSRPRVARPRMRSRAKACRGARNEAWKYTSLRALEQRSLRRRREAPTRAIDASTFALPDRWAAARLRQWRLSRRSFATSRRSDGLSISTLGDARRATSNPGARCLRASTRVSMRVRAPQYGARRRWSADPRRSRRAHRRAAPSRLRRRAADRHRVARARADRSRRAAQRSRHRTSRRRRCRRSAARQRRRAVRARRRRAARSGADPGRRGRRDADPPQRIHRWRDDATLSAHALEIGARSRATISTSISRGRGARFVSRGVFALRGRQHADTHLDVRHDARDTASDMRLARRRRRARARRVPRRDHGRRRAPTAPMRSCRTRTCCFRRTPRSTRSRCSKSMPTK